MFEKTWQVPDLPGLFYGVLWNLSAWCIIMV
jgi:hypothetical protein